MKKRIVGIILSIVLFLILDRTLGLFLNTGLEKYFGLNTHSEILLIGHSHLMLATDKQNIEKNLDCKVSKYCREGVNTIDRFHMVKQYLDSDFSDSLKVVLYGVDQFTFTSEGLSENSYMLFYPFMDEENMDTYIYESAEKLEYWQHKLLTTTRYSDALLNSSIRGWMNNWSNFKFGKLDVEKLKEEVKNNAQRKIRFNSQLKQSFEETLKLLTDRNIIVVLVNTPTAKILNESEPEEYRKAISYFHELDSNSEKIKYLDLNDQFSDKYDLFLDDIHLNKDGQYVINMCIVNYLKNEIKL